MLEKRGVKIHSSAKYKHMHKAFVDSLNKLLVAQLFKVHDVQELNNPKKSVVNLG